MSGVDSTSPHGAHPGVLSDTPTECVTQNVNCAYVPSLPNPTPADITHTSPPETNTRHHANHALSGICETKHDTSLLKTVQ